MSKKTFMATIIITAFLISIVAGVQIGEVVKANPYGDLPSSPNKDPPTITLETLNNTMNDSVEIYLNFTVIYPDSWQTFDYVTGITCQLDNQSLIVFGQLSKVTKLTANLTGVTVGQHVLQINVSSVSLYNPPPLPSNWLDPSRYYSTLTQTIPFTIDAESNVQLSFALPSSTTDSHTTLSPSAQHLSDYIAQQNSSATITAEPSSTPTLTPRQSASPSPIPSLTPSPTITVSPIVTTSGSPTQQPTPTPALPAFYVAAPTVDFAPTLMALLAILALTVAIAVLSYSYFKKRKGQP